MTFQMKPRALAIAVAALVFAPKMFAAPISSCTNNPGSPTVVGGVLTSSFTCDLYNTSSSYSFNLTSLMTQGGAPLGPNLAGAGYGVVINGNPLTISANDTNDPALYNTSLWEAVLYWPSDQPGGLSDTLIVYWPGAFPTASAIQTLNSSLYPKLPQSVFFTAVTGAETTIGAGSTEVYNIFTPGVTAATPEPNSFTLLSSGILGLGLLAAMKRFRNPADQETIHFRAS